VDIACSDILIRFLKPLLELAQPCPLGITSLIVCDMQVLLPADFYP
jgi:hypothetical protein